LCCITRWSTSGTSVRKVGEGLDLDVPTYNTCSDTSTAILDTGTTAMRSSRNSYPGHGDNRNEEQREQLPWMGTTAMRNTHQHKP